LLDVIIFLLILLYVIFKADHAIIQAVRHWLLAEEPVLNLGDCMCGSVVDEVAQEQVLVSPAIASNSSLTLLRRQHIITSLVSKLEASYLANQFADGKVRELGFRFLSL
jgi:hypothetical protein